MSDLKKYQDKTVLEAARDRLRCVFEEFDQIYLSVSAGKDSSVMMQLAAEIARETNSEFDVLFVDLEAQYKATIEHFEELLELCDDVIGTTYWVCLPLSLRNAVSQIQPKWTCWGKEAKDKWVRDTPDRDCVLTEDDHPIRLFRATNGV